VGGLFKSIQVPEQKLEAVLIGMGFGPTLAHACSAAAAASDTKSPHFHASASAKSNDYKSPALHSAVPASASASASAGAGSKSPVPLRLASPVPAALQQPPKLVRQLSANSTHVLESAFARLDQSKSGFYNECGREIIFERV